MDDQAQNNNNNGIEEVQSLGFTPQDNQPKQDVPQQPIPTPQPEPPTPTPNLNATPQSQPQMTNQSTEE
ncbi:hypothetical protein K0B04_03765, partial [Patescibacteria group bacterium]|nr:hypothetical protein [Patescibacteria group bacterium]